MGPLIIDILRFVSMLLTLYSYILLASIILTWLIAFNIVNSRNQFVSSIAEFLYRVTEPVLAPIRRRLPAFGAIDISPIIVFFGIIFIQSVIFPAIIRMVL